MTQAEDRDARLAAALRANLRRRKAAPPRPEDAPPASRPRDPADDPGSAR